MMYHKTVEKLKHLFYQIIFCDRVHMLLITKFPTKFDECRPMHSITID